MKPYKVNRRTNYIHILNKDGKIYNAENKNQDKEPKGKFINRKVRYTEDVMNVESVIYPFVVGSGGISQ